jgi:holo-[acyl-carrier protein] synthase
MDRDRIIAALARISRKQPEQLQPHLSLASLGVSSSFGLSALRSVLEAQSKAKLPALKANMKVDDVIQLLANEPDQAIGPGSQALSAIRLPAGDRVSAPTNGVEATFPGGIGLGMDMQDIASLPVTADYRAHEFYVSHFTPEEIATALLRPDPRAHLCGVFCAKEAAKKSHPDLLNLRMTDFSVSHDPAGRPALHLVDDHHLKSRLQFLLSITHTAEFAAATCLTLGGDVR